MSSHTECIVTGCAFIAPDGRWVAGDLHKCGDALIFVGNINRHAQLDAGDIHPAWMPPSERSIYARSVAPPHWLERRGVFIFADDAEANLSPDALAYIGRGA